jgi:hypothetical protein
MNHRPLHWINLSIKEAPNVHPGLRMDCDGDQHTGILAGDAGQA